MKNPKTVYEVVQILEDYHARRLATYTRLHCDASDAMAKILLEHLVTLEDHALKAVRGELKELDPQRSTYLSSGPMLSEEASLASDCHCADDPSFQAALTCALTSGPLLEELFSRLEGSSAAASVLDLVKRLRDLQQTRERQIANFTRQD